MSLHKEISFELEICQHLAAHGWLYAEGDAAGYDRARALFPADLLAWVQATQPKAWDTLAKNHGSKAADTLLARVRTQLDQRGTLDVLRHGVELLGLKTPPSLAQFKPALAINPDILAPYGANPPLLRCNKHGSGLVLLAHQLRKPLPTGRPFFPPAREPVRLGAR